MKLYIKRLGVERLNMKIDNFTIKLFHKIKGDYPAPTVGTTFEDAEFKVKQCRAEARRSIDDLIIIYRTYLGSVHKKSIFESLERVILSQGNGMLLFCPDVNKWVIHNNTDSGSYGKYIYHRKYCGYGLKNYNSGGSGTTSLKEVLDTLGFKNHKR